MERGVQRWLVDISQWNPSQDRFESLISMLPIHERPAIIRFVKFVDRKRALVSRLLQYSLVHEILGMPFDRIIINRTIEGKPYLENGGENLHFPNFNFNISHHGDYVGIASEPMCFVGLDIISNDISAGERVLEFIKNFSSYFTVLEWKSIIDAGNSDEVLAEFCRYWCLKEAYVKALGVGLGYGLDQLEFHHKNWTNIFIQINGLRSRDWIFYLFELDKGHWAAVAKGYPEGDLATNQRNPAQIRFEREEHLIELQRPESGFVKRAVEQLIPAPAEGYDFDVSSSF